jgi:hypothetical protein
MCKILFEHIEKIQTISNNVTEDWNSMSFSGTLFNEKNKDFFRDLDIEIKTIEINKIINYRIDTEVKTDINDFLKDLFSGSKWSININKIYKLDETKTTFFYSVDEFKKWSKTLNPFNTENPFNKYSKLKIVVRDIIDPIVGTNYIILNQNHSNVFNDYDDKLPIYDKILENVHILSKDKFELNPKNFIIESTINEMSLPFFHMYIITMAASITSEIINENEVVLRGIRKIELKLINKSSLSITKKFIEELRKTVEWIYEEKTDLRLKLFLERITLDINLKNEYLNELVLINKSSFDQSKERYSFILFDRKDQHQKELRDLLKDLKTISDLYSTKARTVLSNLLRDVLAGFFLIAITMFSKIDNPEELIKKPIIILIFKGFSIYFIISIIYQTSMDWFDMNKTEKEFKYWKNTSREYLSEEEFNNHINNTITKRREGTIIFYILLIISYLTIAYCTWDFNNPAPRSVL